MGPDWTSYWTLGNFEKPLAIFVKDSKSLILLVKSFLGNLTDIRRFFTVHTGPGPFSESIEKYISTV